MAAAADIATVAATTTKTINKYINIGLFKSLHSTMQTFVIYTPIESSWYPKNCRLPITPDLGTELIKK